MSKVGEPFYFVSTKIGFKPFSLWYINIIVRLRPVALDRCEHIVVAIDAFTMWVEVGVLR